MFVLKELQELRIQFFLLVDNISNTTNLEIKKYIYNVYNMYK